MSAKSERDVTTKIPRSLVLAKVLLRRLFFAAAAFFLLFCVLVIAAPVWMPWVVRPVAGRLGVEFAEYERLGYSRFALHDVLMERDAFRLSVETAESFQPVVWFYKIITGRSGETDFFRADGWSLTLHDVEAPDPVDSADFIPYESFKLIEKKLPLIIRLLPRATMQGGHIAFANREVHTPILQFRSGVLIAEAEKTVAGRPVKIKAEGDFTAASEICFSSTLRPYGAVLSATVGRGGGVLRVKGDLTWEENRLDFFSTFEPGRQLPKKAGIEAKKFDLPATAPGITQDGRIEGFLKASWEHESYDVKLDISAGPGKKSSPLPKVMMQFHGRGTLEWMAVEKLKINTPWLKSYLEEPLQFGYGGKILNEESVSLHVDVDLEKQPFFTASGTLKNLVDIAPGYAMDPDITITTTGKKIEAFAVYCERILIESGIDREQVNLTSQILFMEGLEMRAEASLPMGGDAWGSLFKERKLPDWKLLKGRLMVEDAGLEPIAQMFPELLSDGGRLSADISFEGGEFKKGRLSLDGASTRPLMPAGPMRDIRARLGFKGRSVIVEELSCKLGGERLTVEGIIELDADMIPLFNLTMQGENIPLIRQPGFVVRSDIDISLHGEGMEKSSVTGLIRLRDSMVVTDWRSITPRFSVESPQRRPPFFSVEQEPFAGWDVDINIEGTEFLSARAPAFQGLFSIEMVLEGTLAEPVLIGNLTVDSGLVRFPFASLDIEHGMVSITRDAPFVPRLSLVASSRTYGYDVEMHLHGTAYEPALEFSSHPPLSSQAILLMITAGELPRDELAFTGQQKATKLTFYIVRNLLAGFGDNGDLVRRLNVRSGENISRQGRETFYVEFMLLPGLGILAEYDRFDAFNFGVKWRFFVR